MAPIGPDQDEDNQFYSVLTEPQDSESSGEELIPTNQSVLQPVHPTVSDSTLPEPLPQSPQNPSLLQSGSLWTHSLSPSQMSPAAQTSGSLDTSPIASRPQRISGCPQQDMAYDVFEGLEDSNTVVPERKPHKRSKRSPDPPRPSPVKKLKKKKDPVIQEAVPPLQDDLQQGAPLTVEQWLKHQQVVDRRFEQLALSFQKTQEKLEAEDSC